MLHATSGVQDCQFQRTADGVTKALAGLDAGIGGDIGKAKCINREAGVTCTGILSISEW